MPLAGGGDGGGGDGRRAPATIVNVHDLERRVVHFGGARRDRARRHLQLERLLPPPLQLDTEIKALPVPNRPLDAACSMRTYQLEPPRLPVLCLARSSSRGTKLSGLDLLLRPLPVLHPTLGFGDRRPKGRVDAPRWRRGDRLGREEAVEIHLCSGALEKRANGGGVKRSEHLAADLRSKSLVTYLLLTNTCSCTMVTHDAHRVLAALGALASSAGRGRAGVSLNCNPKAVPTLNPKQTRPTASFRATVTTRWRSSLGRVWVEGRVRL